MIKPDESVVQDGNDTTIPHEANDTTSEDVQIQESTIATIEPEKQSSTEENK